MSQLTKQQLQVENNASFPNNTTGYITPSLLRAYNSDTIDSFALQTEVDAISSSVSDLVTGSGTWATTGSNTFYGNQLINGDVTIDVSSSFNISNIVTLRNAAGSDITLLDAEDGLQLRNFNTGELQIDQNANADLTITSHLQDIHLYTPSGAIFLNDVDFEQYSASVDTRLNNAQGVQGIQGTTGTQGGTGTQGSTGGQGIQGISGVDGSQGSIGLQGTVGSQGMVGSIGNVGPQGAVGQTGIGTQGYTGPAGPTGNTGAQGTQGAQGSNAGQGATGTQGAIGSQGSTGQSIQGTQGPQGGTGTQGASGTNGTNGNNGAQGSTGTQGVQGIQGSQGAVLNTGSFATTGSNTFTGEQIIQNTLTIQQPDNQLVYTSLLQSAVDGTLSITQAGGNGILINGVGVDINNAGLKLNDDNPTITLALNAAGSGSQYPQINANIDTTTWPNDIFGGFQVQDPSLGNLTYVGMAANSYTPEYYPTPVGWIGGGGNNTNGSNTAFIMKSGSADLEIYKPTIHKFGVVISGSFIQSGSNSINAGPAGAAGTWIQNRVVISGGDGATTGPTPRLWISGSDGAFTEFGRGFINQDTSKSPALGASLYTGANIGNGASNTIAVYTPDTYVDDVELQMFANSSSIGFADWDNGSTFSYVPFMTLTPNVGDNPTPQMTRGLGITGSLSVVSSSAFPDNTGSSLVTYNQSTGQIAHTPYSSALASLFDVGYFYSTITQSGSANVSSSFVFDNTLPINEITLTSGSHINIPKTAWYNFQFSIQVVQGSGAADVAVWLKKNGSNVADTATYITIPSNQKSVLALNIWDNATAGDYYQLAYQSTSNDTTYAYIAPTGNIPASPSVILSVNQIR